MALKQPSPDCHKYNKNYIFAFQVCITQASALRAQLDITVSSQDGQMKQDSASKAISVSKVPPVNNRKSVLLESIVPLVLTHPKTVLLAPFLMEQACGKLSNARTAQLGHIVLN